MLGPMERLSKAAFELGSGQMGSPVTVEGNDEIARVHGFHGKAGTPLRRRGFAFQG